MLGLEELETRDCPSVTVTNPGNQVNCDGDTVSFVVLANDDTTAPLTYSVSGQPAGVSIDAGTGYVHGNISSSADLSSPYTTTVTAADGTDSASQTFAWKVLNPIVLPNPGDQVSHLRDHRRPTHGQQ